MIYWYLFWMQELQSRSKHSNTSHGPPGHHWIKALPVWPWLTGKLLAPCLKLQIAEANLINSQHATWLMQCPTLYLALSCYHLRKCKICNKMPANAEQQLTVLPWRVVKMAEAFDPRHQMQRLKWDVTLALIHAGFLNAKKCQTNSEHSRLKQRISKSSVSTTLKWRHKYCCSSHFWRPC